MLFDAPIQNSETLVHEILHSINPDNVAPILAMKSWENISLLEVIDEINKCGNLYVLYKHPTNNKKDRLTQTTCAELIEYINKKINPYRGEGVDIIVVSSDFDKAFIFNHDGDIFKTCKLRSL